jgi:peptide/nickel transport system permease protein
MARYVLHRLAWAFVLFFVATMITYVIFFLISPIPARFVDLSPSNVTRAQVESALHLDVPIWQQYWIFLWNLVRHLSLGHSFRNGASVRWLLSQEAPVTGSLIFGALFFWLVIAIPIGILSALRPRWILDRFATVFALIGLSMSPVTLGLTLAYAVGYRLKWTPTSGYCNFFTRTSYSCSGAGLWAYHLLLPWVTVSVLFAALYIRMIRSQVIETQNEDYVRTARAKGASDWRVLTHHVLRNCMLPILTMLGMDITLALSSAVFVERVFNLHGIGFQLINSVNAGDVPVVVGIVVFVMVVVIVSNFFVDVAYGWLDPRISAVGESPARS